MIKPINKVISHIARCAINGLTYEFNVTPKPGLVDRNNSGAHKDMDYNTFVASSIAVAPFLHEMANTGYYWRGNLEDLFLSLRSIGIEAEKAMFIATNQVNTHKGLIFSLGIVAAAAAYYYKSHGHFHQENILLLCSEMTRSVLDAEFKQINEKSPKTNGERLYVYHGIKGIRGEVQEGFPSIRSISLPALTRLAKTHDNLNDMLVQVLFHLMAEVEDTNVLSRCGFDALSSVKASAKEILAYGGVFSEEGPEKILSLDTLFIQKNISPGGCADLLAVTIMIYLLGFTFL